VFTPCFIGEEMSSRVKLSAIIDSISSIAHNTSCYLDRERGELFLVSKEQLCAAEKDEQEEGHPEWQKDQIKLARKILTDDKQEKYIAIPAKFVIHEYSTMENFCISLDDEKISKPLCRAIFGGGAFNRFNNYIHKYGIADDWYKYRYNSMKRIIIDWCESNNIDYMEK
jgi:hypothetical protein